MKTWMFVVLIIVLIFVIVPLIYYGITANAVKDVIVETKDRTAGDSLSNFGPSGKVITLNPNPLNVPSY